MVIVVAAAVVHKDGKVLLTRRRTGDHLAGFWEFPGGKLESGEAPEAAAKRECAEECGIAVEVRDILEVTYHRYPEKDVLLLFYDCAWIDGEVRHLQVADHAWVRPAKLEDYELPPADAPVVRKIQERFG